MTDDLSREEVLRIAALARIDIDDDKAEQLRGELAAVLRYADELSELDLDGVPPTFHPGGASGVPLRPDAVTESLPRDRVLSAAPEHDDEVFLVPRILGDG